MPEKFTDKLRVPIFEPRRAPVRGMSSFMDACSLDPGWYSLLQNVRTDKGIIRVRDGHAKLTSTAINSGAGTFGGADVLNYRGVWTGNPVILAAVEESSAVEIHASNTGSSFGEVTVAAGAYGSTRMSALSSGDGSVYFSALRDRLTNDNCAVIQNGVDDPRIYSINATIADTAIHYEITPPSKKMNLISRPGLGAFWNVFSAAAGAPSTPTGTSVTITETALATGDNSLVLAATNPVNGDQAQYTFTSSINLNSSRQLVMVMNGTAANMAIWQNLKVELDSGAGSWKTIYDPTTPKDAFRVVEALDASNNNVMAFSLDAHNGATGMTAIDRIRFTWVGDTVTTLTQSVSIYMIAASGNVPGNALHAYVYSNSTSKAESVPQFVTDVVPFPIERYGGARNLNLNVGNVPGIFYNYSVNIMNTSTAERDKGTDKIYLYRQDDGEDDYYYVSTTTLATYSSGWSFSSGSALSTLAITDSTLVKNTELKIPDPEHIPIPKGKAMLLANGRLWIAGGGTLSNKLYISEHRYHNRFRETPRLLDDGSIDAPSATMYPFDGESIQAMISSSVGYGGASFVYIFTDKSVYMIGPDIHRIEKLASSGTTSPRSVAEYNGTVAFLDSQRRVLELRNGVITDISDRLVEDILLAIPSASATTSRILKPQGKFWKGNYYLSYTPSGGATNTRYLFWDTQERKWYDNLNAEGTMESLLIWNSAGVEMLVHIGSNLHLYQTEKAGQTADNATNPTIVLTTGEIKLEDWAQFAFGRVGVICTDVSGGTITVSRSYKPGSGTASTSSINIDVSTDLAWKYDGAITLNDARGNRGALSLSATLPGGTAIYEIVAELHPRRTGVTT